MKTVTKEVIFLDYKSIKWKPSYTTSDDDLIGKFYKPAIELASSYKRMTGYFSPIFLENLVNEIKASNQHNNMKIYIICSPEMNQKDLDNINLGYEIRAIFENSIEETLKKFTDEKAEEILPIISDLIANDVLDIKFALTKNNKGMFHAKNGIFTDFMGNKIGFSGSNNETYYAVNFNYESFTVFTDWETPRHVNDIEQKFDEMWEGKNDNISIQDVSKLILNEIDKKIPKEKFKENKLKPISLPSNVILRDYQLTAIENWKNNDYEGIFEMATGTGKTITALGAINALSDTKKKLVTVIVVPQTDLMYQWEDDISDSGAHVTLCHGDNPKWPEWLQVRLQGLMYKDEGFLNVLVTNATFSSKRFQNIIKNINLDFLLVSDEVHSFGSDQIRKLYPKLSTKFKYKLGLSATPFRKNISETNQLKRFFDGTVYSYTLKKAIDNGVLNQYNYYPKLMYYEDELINSYRDVYYKNRDQFLKSDINAINELDRITTSIANKSTAKINEVYESISNREDDFRLIVYCAPGNYNDIIKEYNNRHIDYVAKKIGNLDSVKLRMVRSQVPSVERKEILNQFIQGELNTLVAIKCLDQGIDLPNVKDAYIMSSFDSETEFIQRRGRILRTYEGKPVSNIYDYIMLPQNLDSPTFFADEADAYLVDRELKRIKSYMNGATNENEIVHIVDKIEIAYKDVLEDYYEKH